MFKAVFSHQAEWSGRGEHCTIMVVAMDDMLQAGVRDVSVFYAKAHLLY